MNCSTLNLSDFQIVLPPTRSITMSEIRITPLKIIFSPVAVADLLYAKHICVLYNGASKQLAFAPSAESSFTIPFLSDNPETTSKSLPICHALLVKAIRKEMKWNLTRGTYRIRGVKVPDSNFLLFDLTMAESGKRKSIAVTVDDFLKNCPSAVEISRQDRFKPVMKLPEAQVVAFTEVV